MKTFQRTNWSNEQILKFLDGQKIVNGEGVVDNYCQGHNDTIDDIKDFFYDFMRPETEFGATGYCVEEDTVYHIGGLPEPLRAPIKENECAILHTEDNKTFQEKLNGKPYCIVCGEDWP